MNLQALTRPAGPWGHQFIGASAAAQAAVWDLERARKIGVARVLRSKKCATARGLHDELAAALQFPLHYGENFDALRDCLRDLSWLPPGPMVLAFLDADELLRSAPAKQFALLVNVLNETLDFWNEPADKRKVVPFHILVQAVSPGEVETRWKTAGLNLVNIE